MEGIVRGGSIFWGGFRIGEIRYRRTKDIRGRNQIEKGFLQAIRGVGYKKVIFESRSILDTMSSCQKRESMSVLTTSIIMPLLTGSS